MLNKKGSDLYVKIKGKHSSHTHKKKPSKMVSIVITVKKFGEYILGNLLSSK